jgi:alpha/beta superfamily hydrolase
MVLGRGQKLSIDGVFRETALVGLPTLGSRWIGLGATEDDDAAFLDASRWPSHYGSMTLERYTVETPDGGIAAEIHCDNDAPAAVVVVFVPGAPRDATPARVTSRWESSITSAVRSAGAAFVTFNYVGIGASGGEMATTSIASRRSQVEEVIRFARSVTRTLRLVLVGCSMGGHIVATLCRRCGADGAALIVPAAYGLRAEAINFGPDLSTELRRPDSWRDSPAFDEYRAFTGRKLLIAPQGDEVIPPEITRIYAGMTDAEFIWRPANASHRFLACLTPEDAAVTHESVERVAAFVDLCVTDADSVCRPSTEKGAVA